MKVAIYIKALLFFLLGLFVIIFRNNVISYLNFIVGPVIILSALDELIFKIIINLKFSEEHKFHLHTPISMLILGIIITILHEKTLEFVCIIWGCISIVEETKEINHFFAEKKKNIFLLIRSVIGLVLGIILILDPLEHVLLHIIILGCDFMIDSLRLVLNSIFIKSSKDIDYLEE